MMMMSGKNQPLLYQEALVLLLHVALEAVAHHLVAQAAPPKAPLVAQHLLVARPVLVAVVLLLVVLVAVVLLLVVLVAVVLLLVVLVAVVLLLVVLVAVVLLLVVLVAVVLLLVVLVEALLERRVLVALAEDPLADHCMA
jgi:hypothetical protein